MSPVDPSTSLLATCGGDTVKLFDVTVDSGDPCTLSYCPSPGSQVNCVKWNHTNLVVASAGDDKKISLWHKYGQNLGTVPLSESNAGNDLEESVVAVNFSNKGSRYLCSGGSGRMVRVWDLQKKRCIKRLSGHKDTITGVMYNYKDEHLASISMKGDLIIHNLASGARTAELKDPNGQVLRVLDYTRLSRHILVTAGDEGSVHLWDTTGRIPKVSWLKQHSAPITGVCFSPSNDKIIASVGLDKKMYTFDSGTRKPTSCSPYEAPFSSLAYSDDGNILAAGTNTGRVVFYDVRGKPEPFTVLRAYNTTEAVTCLCWQRSKPTIVNENSCTAETALLGGNSEDSILMPDPLPSVPAPVLSSSTSISGSHSSLTEFSLGSASTTCLSTAEETPYKNRLWKGGSLSTLQAPHTNYKFKDDMDVFSPLADVQPITPSLSNWWDDKDEAKKEESTPNDNNSMLFSTSTRRFPFTEGNTLAHAVSDWRTNSTSNQDDSHVSELAATPVASVKNELSFSPTPPEAWGGTALPDDLRHRRQPVPTTSPHNMLSISLASGSIFAGFQDSFASTSHSIQSFLANTSLSSTSLQGKATSSNENSSLLPESSSLYLSTTLGTKAMTSSTNLELPGPVLLTLPRRYSTFAERMSTASSSSDGIGLATASPKSKKTGSETREELLNNLLARQDASTVTGAGSVPAINGLAPQPRRAFGHPSDQQQGTSSFSLQLVQRTLEETLGTMQSTIHEDVKNLHLELLRQFHMQELEMSNLLASVLEKQDELMKEVQSLRRENHQLRRLL